MSGCNVSNEAKGQLASHQWRPVSIRISTRGHSRTGTQSFFRMHPSSLVATVGKMAAFGVPFVKSGTALFNVKPTTGLGTCRGAFLCHR